MQLVTDVMNYVQRLVTRPVGELNRAQRTLRFWVQLVRHCTNELREDRAAQMAAALTYRTIFGLVPVFVLALLAFRALGGFEQLGEDLRERMYDYFGLSQIVVTDPLDAAAEEGMDGVAVANSEQETIRRTLDDLMAGVEDRIATVSFTSIGAVGLPVLIWAALSLVVTVEQCFNRIYNCPSGRGWHLRIPIYWSVLTLAPVLLMTSLWITGGVVSTVDAYAAEASATGALVLEPLRWLMGLASRSAALIASWLLLFLIYVLMPSTKVKLRPALIGALVAALLWEGAKAGFKLYVTKAVTVSALYGSLGLIPLFLFWLYLTWLIVLFGLELTYTLQMMPEGRFKSERRQEGQVLYDPRWMIPVMAAVGQAFTKGAAVAVSELSRELGLPIRVVDKLTDHLHEAGLLHRVAGDRGDDAGYALARPPQQIPLAQVLTVAQTAGESDKMRRTSLPGHAYVERLTAAQTSAAADATLADLIEGK